jgi:hypothetical protein
MGGSRRRIQGKRGGLRVAIVREFGGRIDKEDQEVATIGDFIWKGSIKRA